MIDFFIVGQVGRLEAKYIPPLNKDFPVVLILNPSGIQGGRLDNNIIKSMVKVFHMYGVGSLRFNYRGIGSSEGRLHSPQIIDEYISDAVTALDWLQKSAKPSVRKFWIGGFSFGALVAMHVLMRRPELEHFVIVSPNFDKYDFSFMNPCPVSGGIMYGSHDKFINEERLIKFTKKLTFNNIMEIRLMKIDNADHAIGTEVNLLEKLLAEHVKECVDKEIKRVAV